MIQQSTAWWKGEIPEPPAVYQMALDAYISMTQAVGSPSGLGMLIVMSGAAYLAGFPGLGYTIALSSWVSGVWVI